MIQRLVLFGATGDLAGRYVLPPLAALQAAGRLPSGFDVIGGSRENIGEEAFRRSASESLEQHAAKLPGKRPRNHCAVASFHARRRHYTLGELRHADVPRHLQRSPYARVNQADIRAAAGSPPPSRCRSGRSPRNDRRPHSVQAPTGEFDSWFIALTADEELLGFLQLEPDLALHRD